MLRAVPAMIFAPASRSRAERSSILRSAISRHCWRVTVPTFLVFGSPEPDSMPAAFFRRTAGRALDDEVEAVVHVDEDFNRDDHPVEVFGAVVERLDKLPNVHVCRTECRPDRRSRRRLATGSLQLQFFLDFLGHDITSFMKFRDSGGPANHLRLSGDPVKIRSAKFSRLASIRVRRACCGRRSLRSRAPGLCRAGLRRRSLRYSRMRPL